MSAVFQRNFEFLDFKFPVVEQGRCSKIRVDFCAESFTNTNRIKISVYILRDSNSSRCHMLPDIFGGNIFDIRNKLHLRRYFTIKCFFNLCCHSMYSA